MLLAETRAQVGPGNLMLAPGGLLEHTGDLQGAAKIHRANGSMLRAAHLFERAAREAPVQR